MRPEHAPDSACPSLWERWWKFRFLCRQYRRNGGMLSAERLIFLALTCGLALLISALGLAGGLKDLAQSYVGSSLPTLITVQPATLQAGPFKLKNDLSPDTLEKLRRLPGVTGVYPCARLRLPAQIFASYGGQSFTSEAVVEGIAPQVFSGELSPDSAIFQYRGEENDIPAVLPRIMTDLLEHGLSVNTGLPFISADLIIGHHFTLRVGQSSFSTAKASPGSVRQSRCVISGISSLVGAGGPTLPLEVLERWSNQPLVYHAAAVRISDTAYLNSLFNSLPQLGLCAPKARLARSVTDAFVTIRAVLCGLGLGMLLLVAGALHTILSLHVCSNARRLGLFRVLGATTGDIMRLHLSWGFSLGLRGSLAGTMLGVLTGWGLNSWCARSHVFSTASGELWLLSPVTAAGVALISLLVCTLACLLPAYRAAGISPLESQRS